MKKYAHILIFFALLEWQALACGGGYCLVTLGGLFMLALYQVLFRRRPGIFADGRGQSAPLSGRQKIMKTAGAEAREHDITANGLYHISVVFLYVISFYLGSQMASGIAYQSVIVITCLVLLNLERRLDPAFFARAAGTTDQNAYLGKLLNGWIKYWMFFLGVWSIMSMHGDGIFSRGVEHFLIFMFIALLYAVYLHNIKALTPVNLVGTLFLAAFLTGLSPVMQVLTGIEIPHYLQALMILVALDAGNIYFRRRIGGEKTTLIPFRKRAAAYAAAVIFITQLHFVMSDPSLDLHRVYASIMGSGKAGMTSVLDAERAESSPAHAVPDPQNASRGVNLIP